MAAGDKSKHAKMETNMAEHEQQEAYRKGKEHLPLGGEIARTYANEEGSLGMAFAEGNQGKDGEKQPQSDQQRETKKDGTTGTVLFGRQETKKHRKAVGNEGRRPACPRGTMRNDSMEDER